MEKENSNAITERKTDTKHKKQSVWERFMTLYTCLLPIVVIGILIYHLLDLQYSRMHGCCPVTFPDYYFFIPFLLYVISVYASLVLIPIILASIKTYDFFNQNKGYNHCVKLGTANWKTSIYRICKRFRYSFIGEMIYIFLYFVMFGALLWGAPSTLYAFCDLFTKTNNSIHFSDGQGEGWSGLAWGLTFLMVNIIVTLIILIIFFYVLIRRICEYKNKRAKKMLKTIKRKELQAYQSSPEQQKNFDEEKKETE